MQQRVEPHDSLDYFPTPPWATRALCERLILMSPLHLLTVWEPACGEGHMAKPLGEFFDKVIASDVHDYSATYPAQDDVCDFLTPWDHPIQFQDTPPNMPQDGGADWIITNPPFRLGEKFIWTALKVARQGVAVLVRTAFLEGVGRHKSLFSVKPPSLILQFTERVPMVKGRLDKGASSATSYCWIVWEKNPGLTGMFEWVAPCRKRLEKARDYPAPPEELPPIPLFDGGENDPFPHN